MNPARTALTLALAAAALAVAACAAPQPDGAALFADNCARCHGEQAEGTDYGPPLAHRIYEPGHHPDWSFQNAVANGVPAHHWDFGDMPPISGLSEDDVAAVIAHIRSLQRESGIIQ